LKRKFEIGENQDGKSGVEKEKAKEIVYLLNEKEEESLGTELGVGDSNPNPSLSVNVKEEGVFELAEEG